MVEAHDATGGVDDQSGVIRRLERRAADERIGVVRDQHEREATTPLGDVLHSQVGDAHLRAHMDHRQRRGAPESSDELLHDLGIRKADDFVEIFPRDLSVELAEARHELRARADDL